MNVYAPVRPETPEAGGPIWFREPPNGIPLLRWVEGSMFKHSKRSLWY